MSPEGMAPVPADDRIPAQVTETVTRGTVTPTYPVIQYPHTPGDGGDAIAGGFVYRGCIPALQGKLVFGDITTGRLWHADMRDVMAADDGDPATVAAVHEIDAGLRPLVERSYRSRGGTGAALPGFGRVSGRGRVDVRLAMDADGELCTLTKSDGVVRKIVGASDSAATSGPLTGASESQANRTPAPAAATPTNSTPSTPESVAAGKRTFDTLCAACHGSNAQGAVKAGISISIIEEQRGKQPPDLTDAQWDHGPSDGEVFNVIKRGVPPTMMPPFGGAVTDRETWNVINYVRSLGSR